MNFPNSQKLVTYHLAKVFNNTATSYKFYWFYVLIQVIKSNREQIIILELLVRMVASVWYPVHYFKLSFGVQDKLGQAAIKALQIKELGLNQNDKFEKIVTTILQYIQENPKSELAKQIKSFGDYVPFRFIRPWCEPKIEKGLKDGKLNRNIKYIANTEYQKLQIPYYFEGESIVFHPAWLYYFQEHLKIMEDFCLWNLLNYLQKRNPNVPNIASKLFPPNPKERSLSKERKFWKAIYENTETPFRCIFSDELIDTKKYALDHFIPWSFVTHNQLWNLVPIIPSVNSQKSDKLPDMNTYFKKFGHVQYDVFQLGFKLNPKSILLEKYLGVVGNSLEEIKALSEPDFILKLENQIQPLAQIAQNMGFQNKWIYQK